MGSLPDFKPMLGMLANALQPATEPLPEEVETWDAELEWEEQGGHVCPVVYMRRVNVGQVAEPYVKHSDYAAQARRLAEVEAERDSEARWASQYAQESHAALSRAEAAEAKLKRIEEWAASRCICLHVGLACPKGRFTSPPQWSTFGTCDAWTPPKEWEE